MLVHATGNRNTLHVSYDEKATKLSPLLLPITGEKAISVCAPAFTVSCLPAISAIARPDAAATPRRYGTVQHNTTFRSNGNELLLPSPLASLANIHRRAALSLHQIVMKNDGCYELHRTTSGSGKMPEPHNIARMNARLHTLQRRICCLTPPPRSP